MGHWLSLTADDGHTLQAYRAEPKGAPRGGIVLLQEIFGVNAHIRSVCDGFAEEGYLVVAPALFDRVERGVELGYTPDTTTKGRALRGELGWDAPLRDARAALVLASPAGKVAAVGYCWGGSLAFLCAARLDGVAAAVAYYGGQIVGFASEPLRCPVLMHFGARDALIPPADVEAIRAAQPGALVHVYDADHGFSCDARASHDAAAASLARERTLAFLAQATQSLEKVG
jgi:carboxymethylenebutenolidase